MKLKEFQEYLENQTNLSRRSIKVYLRTLKRFLFSYRETTIENMNKFIKHYSLAKFVFRYWLKFLGKENEYAKLIKVRERAKKREGTFLNREDLKQIVFSIKDEKYRIVALIQFITGARAVEILKLKKDDFKLLENGELRIRIVGKGERERIVFIPNPYSEIVWKWIENAKEYPFLRITSQDFARVLETNYHYYYLAVKNAARKLGYVNFATHDFRRNFIDEAYSVVKDIRVVQVLAGHAKAETTLRYFKKKVAEEEFRKYIRVLR